MSINKAWSGLLVLGLLAGCSSNPPKSTYNNICAIYDFDDDWQDAARASEKRWGVPSYILMAFVHQESRFKHDAQPERPYFLGLIPLPRDSSAYGYAQAQDPAWKDYQKASGNWGASRSDVEDALDFIGWYNYESSRQLGISRKDTYNLYLAYHEGRGGYSRRTYNQKPWLKRVAQKVANQANVYRTQLQNCDAYIADSAEPIQLKTTRKTTAAPVVEKKPVSKPAPAASTRDTSTDLKPFR
ncbi:transglycosylase SLT domain-containing protein [Thiomicrorhabdus cannonii]|uniref:transglycosylase SLT domain-containing protein n=1 Tax=Thiomicrorhabdus cannonii TaxID=2748011 RepID=UPI0015BEE22E|nr:transglycosylase SLT domain-containing protein [Thiomicrorhabdus cannonii]